MFMKNSAFTKTAICTGVAVAALTAVAGCNSSKASTAGRIAGAASTASTASTAGTSTSSAAAAPVKLAPAAAIQVILGKASSGNQSVTVTGTSTSKSGNSQFTGQEQFGSDYAMQVNETSNGASTSVILTGNAFYIKSPAMASLTGGKPWAELDLSGTGTVNSAFEGALQSMRSEDPTQQLQAMLASDDLTDVGPATVNGVQTEEYSGTIDPATAFSSSATAKYLTQAQIQSMQSALKAAGITSEQLEVWVGPNSLPAEVKVTTDSSVLGTTTSDMFFTNWGAAVTVTPPPASQVSPLSSLLGGSQ
jgi:hypothetical protein